MTVRPEVVESGIDYITVTATRAPHTKTLLSVIKEKMDHEVRAGNEPKRWRGLGYSGMFAGGASWGVGPEGTLARLSSGLAAEHWKELYESGSSCTRIDLQVTYRIPGGPTKRLSKDWSAAVAHWQTCKRRKKPHLHSGPHGPESIELGSRQSERFGREYDKFVESTLDHYRECLRFEVEFKGSLAKGLARSLAAMPPASLAIGGYISRFFTDHRIQLPAPMYGPSQISVPRPPGTRARQLRYLHTSVRPMVVSLISNGMVQEVFTALELTEFLRKSDGD